jgi:hypothetical protein
MPVKGARRSVADVGERFIDPKGLAVAPALIFLPDVAYFVTLSKHWPGNMAKPSAN